MRLLRNSKRRHEARKFIRKCFSVLEKYASITASVGTFTTGIRTDGTGVFYLPSLTTFERMMPRSTPTGMVFLDGSFLVVKKVFCYDYPSDDATEPQICYLEYGYHYQRPQGNSFFRYDFHPGIGETETHPLYHLHAAGWRNGANNLPSVPRFPVQFITLDEVLELIRINFFE